ncbi:DNA ligase D [Alteromonas pelagimontana]|uniref:DNA ligase (ATP) n=1 Tax=Alteromonas pelagimontana TaxID=1858656 RepID=A0A6M4MF99_9ALTE|nr:DNA ligase D [Alteromonas pelagimontana]QJR81667.1 DNA ligase D [Alteromonas pelagimontana]
MPSDALKKYNEKRNFENTSEPQGEISAEASEALSFVVQKHAATRLHYDFRLEWNGVMWSWAVPKGPSFNPNHKRLAVRTEDHPISYRTFEGVIPKNQYGAGPVMVWDAGTWESLEENTDDAIKKGKIHFRLSGDKLAGEWTLARMKGAGKGKENWLLMKKSDDKSVDDEQEDFLEKTDYSVISGLKFDDIANGITKKKSGSTASLASLTEAYSAVQLATLVDKPPKGADWLHEVKYDGYRILVYFCNGRVRINTRNGHNWTDKFPRLRDAFEKLEVGDFVVDGEAVVVDSNGITDFKSLQNALGDESAPMQAFFFDLLNWNGDDYAKQPFAERRQALEKLFEQIPSDPLFISQTISGEGKDVIEKACELGLEGIISKRNSSPYTTSRSRYWLKTKCENRQEFIICGLIPSTAERLAVGSLHLGYYKNDVLCYAGKVGTGFSRDEAKKLYAELSAIKRKQLPFPDSIDSDTKDTVWVEPELLCEVKFAAWTSTGKVRHASYQGRRADKTPEKIQKETPAPVEKSQGSAPMKAKTKTSKRSTNPRVENIPISHPDRKIFPEAEVTKEQLARFYSEMKDYIIPVVAKRPISTLRCPKGISEKCFFQRNKGSGMSDNIHSIEIAHKDSSHDYMYINSISGLIEFVQLGVIELHPWNVRVDNSEKPDRLIFDLDPGEDVPFEAIKLATLDIKRRLEELGLVSFLKCTGGKGLHVTVPVQRRLDWETAKTFCRNFAKAMVSDTPDAYTINMSKAKRGGKIFLDYLRNDYASTAVMDYSVRARAGAPVAVPLNWNELDGLEAANQFSIDDVLERKNKKQLFEYPSVNQQLTKEVLNQYKS